MFWKIFCRKRGALRARRIKEFEDIRDRGIQLVQVATKPDAFSQLERQIRGAFRLYHRWYANNDVDRVRGEEVLAAKTITGLPYVFMFHGDGWVREAALNQLDGPLDASANVFGLFNRLNDWAPEVRDAAARAAERCLPDASADVITPAVKAVLPHVPNWGRWSQDGPEAINALLMRQDIAELMLGDIMKTRASNLGLFFREIARNPWIDPHLGQVLQIAVQPHIRAMALDGLITKKMRWPARKRQKVWIDRPAGQFRLEHKFFERDLTVDVDLAYCLRVGAKDRASSVRKRAADGLNLFRNDAGLGGQLDEIAATLENDKNLGVQRRMEFLQRKRLEEGSGA